MNATQTARRILTSRTVLVSGAAASGLASWYLYREYRALQQLQQLLQKDGSGQQPPNPTDDSKTKKKQILTIPFDRLKLVQRRSGSEFLQNVSRRLRQSGDNDLDDTLMTMPVSELVDLIHTAAGDPRIAGLAARFGNRIAGVTDRGYAWADVEAIRNALLVFGQSHRRHREPGTTNHTVVCPRVEPKPMYCYTPSFLDYGGSGSGLMSSATVNYYLASTCSHVHLQQRGQVGLLGLYAQNLFLRGLLQDQWNIRLHVFRHGAYKTAPNVLTESKLTPSHRESVQNMVEQLQTDLALDMTASRSKALLRAWFLSNKNKMKNHPKNNHHSSTNQSLTTLLGGTFDEWCDKVMHIWHQVHRAGAFSAASAVGAGLVDYAPRRDPLPALLAYSNGTDDSPQHEEAEEATRPDETEPSVSSSERDAIRHEWQAQETDFDSFPDHAEAVSLPDYARQQRQLRALQAKRAGWQRFWQTYNLPFWPSVLSSGDTTTTFDGKEKNKKETVLLAHVSGAIDEALARKLVTKLRQATAPTDNNNNNNKDDIKCVVLRITSPGGDAIASETISQELQALPVPVVVSMGNVAASGGYYIAAHADRIFAANKTLTGSIGVFAIRADLTGLANKYGITTDPVATGTLAGTFDSLTPMSRAMQDGVAEAIDRVYDNFKTVVSDGRKLDKTTVEALAQGKIWTGRQAKEIGLVDEIGGLDRALAYAKRTYCTATSKNEDGTDNLEDIPVVTMGGKDDKMVFRKMIKSLVDPDGGEDKEKRTGDPYSVSMNHSSGWQTMVQSWMETFLQDDGDDDDDSGLHLFPTTQNGLPSTQGFCQWLLQQDKPASLGSSFSTGILMTANENSAIQLLMKDVYKRLQ